MRALITGITGQDGSYLAELLLKKGYEVHGLIRRTSSFSTSRIDHIFNRVKLHYGDLTDGGSLMRVVDAVQPDEIYNLGCMSHVRVSFDTPVYCHETIIIGTMNLLEAIRQCLDITKVKFYQASSSEIFGSEPPPQNELTRFSPRSPYACSKLCAYYQVINYREAYGLFACNGILFNHEAARRGETFVTRKITRAATRIKLGLQDELVLGNLDAKRDWGYSPDYVNCMYMMLQHSEPGDYVVATDEMHSVREFVEAAFDVLGLDWKKYVKFSEAYLRPTEVDALCGDSSKARSVLGWEPTVDFEELVEIMVRSDLELARREKLIRDQGVNFEE